MKALILIAGLLMLAVAGCTSHPEWPPINPTPFPMPFTVEGVK